MNSKKNNRRSLFYSVISLLLCISMLLGTTLAWFSDSVSSTGNIIKTGRLKVAMDYKDDLSGEWQDASKATIFNGNLWEPGYSVMKYLRVSNTGNLAFTYQLNILPEEQVAAGEVNLADVIDVYVGEVGTDFVQPTAFSTDMAGMSWLGTLSSIMGAENDKMNGILLADEEKTYCVILHMQETAGNEYQNLTVGNNFTIQVVANQYNYEEDSFGSEYDNLFPEMPGTDMGSADVTVDDQNKLTEDVVLKGEVVSAVVTAGTLLEEGTTKLVLTVTEKDDTEANITLGENEELRALDVHVEGIAADNTVPVIVSLGEIAPEFLNQGNLTLAHVEDGQTILMTRVSALSELDAHNEYYYDIETGALTLAMATFSDVAVVADTKKAWEGEFDYTWYDASKTELTIANADQLAAFGAIVGGMAKDEEENYIYTATDSEGKEYHNDSFSGKTVKLLSDINLGYGVDVDGHTYRIFYPIGYNSDDGKYEKTGVAVTTGFYNFCGTFDGNGHTIANFYQNTWEMKGDNEYYTVSEQCYRDGMGLFGRIYKGTVKNLTVSNFSSDGEYTTTGCIAAYADGATFENIAIFNCNPRVYNIGNGGIVGCVGWYAKEAGLETTFTNITVDNSNKISALWGSYDVACGGLVGQYYPTSGQTSAGTPKNAGIHMENCHVAAQMDVYNDVCANYQYYAYRYAGMLIGSVRENVTIDGHSYPKMDGISAEDCTVNFGTWNDYYYCEIIDNTTASYTHDYQMSRLTEIKAIDGTTITYLDGTTGTVPASGRANYVIVDYSEDKGHGTNNATCYHFKDGTVWNHEDGGYHDGTDGGKIIDENGDGNPDLKEDKQHLYLEFNNLVTGYGWGVTSRALTNLDGVEAFNVSEGDYQVSVYKFNGSDVSKPNNKVIKIGELFTAIEDAEIAIVTNQVQVTVSPAEEGGTISAEYVPHETDWTKGTLTFIGTGKAYVTITDYYFCKATTITVDVTDRQPAEKFDVAFDHVPDDVNDPDTLGNQDNTAKYTYRVGNMNTVALSSLFEAVADADIIGNVNVEITTQKGNATSVYTENTSDWTKGTIQFSNTGIVKVTIKDDDQNFCEPTELVLEVVTAKNATSATSATANNVVMLNDAGFGSLEVKNGYTLYGNGFTLTCASDAVALDMGYSFVTMENGTLDNVQIVAPNFSHSILYKSNYGEPDESGKRYHNIRSAVMVSGNSLIANSKISGGRAAVYATGGDLVIDNSTIVGGAAANIHIGAANSITLKDVTLIQTPTRANVNDTSKKVMGLSIVTVCDSQGNTTPITLEGDFNQYAWAVKEDVQYIPDASGALGSFDVVSYILNNRKNYVHKINGVDSVNLGICYLPDDKAPNKPTVNNNSNNDSYEFTDVNTAYIYTIKNSASVDDVITSEPIYSPNTQGTVLPEIAYTDINENCVMEKAYSAAKNAWEYSLSVDLDKGAYNFDFAKLAVQSGGVNVSYTVKGLTNPGVVPVTSGTTTYTIEVTTKDGEYTFYLNLIGNETSKEAPKWSSDAAGSALSATMNASWKAGLCVATKKGGTWHGAAPALENVYVRYYSTAEKAYKIINLADYTPTSKGKLNGTNTTYTINGGDFTLTLTGGQVHSGNNVYAMPVVVQENSDYTLYFVPAAEKGLVNSGNSARTVPVTYTFTDGFGNTLSGSHTWSITEDKTNPKKYSSFCNGTVEAAGSGCLAEGTLITLADGTQKPIEKITYADELLAWDFHTGAYVATVPSLIEAHEVADYRVINLKFADGTVTKVVVDHGFFDVEKNNYVVINEGNVASYVGHEFMKVSENGAYEAVELVDYEVKIENVSYYSIQTAIYNNSIADGMFTLPAPPEMLENDGWFDYFEIGEGMKYDEEKKQAEIEKYGLYTYEDFAEYVTYEQFIAFNGPYLKILVGRGVLTFEQIFELIATYVNP